MPQERGKNRGRLGAQEDRPRGAALALLRKSIRELSAGMRHRDAFQGRIGRAGGSPFGGRQMSGPSKDRAKRIPGTRGLSLEEALLFERGSPGRVGYMLPESDGIADVDPEKNGLEAHLLGGQTAGMPELTEFDVVRHFTRLSQWNYSIDAGFFPLGSCTMKYNPRVNDAVAALDGFARLHPL